MRRLRWAAWFFGFLAAAVPLAAVALRVFLPPAKVKALALSKLSTALGREVRLGDASVSLRGVRLDDLEVSEVPDFKAGTALRARLVRVTPEWLPLILHRRVAVGELDLAGLEAVYEAKPATKAAPKQAAKGKAPAPAPAAAAGGLALSVGKVTLKDGRFTYRAPGVEAVVTGAEFTAAHVRLDGPVPFTAGLDFKVRSGGATHAGRVDVKGKLDAARGDLAKASLAFDPLAVALDGLKASARGSVTDLAAPRLDAELSLPRLERASNPALAALPEGVAVPALSGPLKAEVRPAGLAIETLSLTGEGAALDVRAAEKGSRWDVAKAAARWGPFALRVSGGADTGGKTPALDLKVHLDPASLAEAAKLAPMAAAYRPQGTLAADVAVKGPASAPALTGTASLADAGGEAQGQKLTGVSGRLSFAPDSASGMLAGKLNGVPFAVKLDGKELRRSPWLRIDGKIARLDLAALPAGQPAAKPAETGAAKTSAATAPAAGGTPFRVQGKLEAGSINHPNFQAGMSRLTFDVRGAGSDIARMDGSASLRMGAGRFEDLRVVAEGKPLLKALLLPVLVLQKTAALVKVPFFPSFDTFTFSEISGDYALEGGVVTVRQSKLVGTTADAELSGTADVVKGPLDMRAKVRVGGKGALRLGGEVAFKVGGSMAQPSVSLDIKSVLEQPAVRQAVDKTLEQGVNVLKGLFK